jgi:hypothetical protein
LEQAWKWLGDAAKGAWDAMLNIGREQTKTENSTLNENIAEAQKGQKMVGYGTWKRDFQPPGDDKTEICSISCQSSGM